jgi:xylan 1,4-beta-xylosidase
MRRKSTKLSTGIFIRVLFTTMISVAIISACSLNDGNRPEGAEKGVAYFDEFTYSGNDDYYNNYPLTSESAFYNPILPGWYSDPSICTNGEDYFLVTSTFVNFPGVPIFHSNDLVNWKQIGHVLTRESQLLNMIGQHTSGGIFAPAIEYNPHNQTYYMITTNVGYGNFFVKTKDPFGAWSDPIRLPDVGGIDPSFFFDDDGKAYIVNNDEPAYTPEYDGHRAIRIREFDVETDQTIGENKVLVDKGVRPEEKPIWIEGPHIYKINGKYFLMSAEGGTGPMHSEVIMRGDSPWGPYTPWENNPILTQRHLDPDRPNPITCAGHADLIQTKEGDWWAVFLATRPIDNKFENLGRETFLMPVRWSDDGFPYLTQGDELIPMSGERPGVKRTADVTFGNFSKTETFSNDTLAMEWMTMRKPATEYYSLSSHPGFLALKCGTPATKMETPAFVTRRIQHHQFEATAKMYFEPTDSTQAAGILLYKDERHQYFLAVEASGETHKISVKKISRNGNEILASQDIDMNGKVINLKVTSSGTSFDFYFASGNSDWQLLADQVDAQFLSTANSFGFTGTTIGLYAEQKALN